LTVSKAKTVLRIVLTRKFGRYFTDHNRTLIVFECDDRRSATKIVCSVDWMWPHSFGARRWRNYVGTVAIRRTGSKNYRYALRVSRTAHPSRRTEVFKDIARLGPQAL
jgi:hypothetical protein